MPIENTELKSYDGGKNTIRSLNVTVDSAKGKSGAGLFAEVPDEMRFTNVRKCWRWPLLLTGSLLR